MGDNVHTLTPDKVSQFKEAFTLYDKDADGKILTKELGIVMRCMGQAPTEADLENYLKQYDASNTGLITFENFLKIVETHATSRSFTEEEMVESFKLFDKDGLGFISVAEMRHIMTNLGEKLTEEQVEEMIKLADANQDGQIKYADFVKRIMT